MLFYNYIIKFTMKHRKGQTTFKIFIIILIYVAGPLNRKTSLVNDTLNFIM